MRIKIIVILYVASVYAGDVIASDVDSLVNEGLAAVAQMSVERAQKIRGMYISNTIREELCGYDKWDSSLYMNKKLHVYFPETCKSVRYKWAQNVDFDASLIRSIKYDVLDSSIHVIFNQFYGQVIYDSVKKGNLDEKYGENLGVAVRDKYNNILIKTKSILRDAYSDNQEAIELFKKYYDPASLLSLVAGDVQSINIINDIFSLSTDTDINLAKAQKRLLDILIVSAYYELKTTVSERYPDLDINISLSAFNEKIKSYEYQYKDTVRALEDTADYYTKFILYYEFLSQKNIKVNEDGSKHVTYPNISKAESIKHIDNLIRILTMYVQILEHPERDQIKPILESYASDINSREVRYWDRVWSAGTLLGFSAGVSNNNTQDGVAAFFPFGIMSTRGRSMSWMVHFFDLGQYLNYSDTDVETEWKDALVPGVSYIFARNRRYPINAGVDVSYIPGSSKNNLDDDIRYSIFISLELSLWDFN